MYTLSTFQNINVFRISFMHDIVDYMQHVLLCIWFPQRQQLQLFRQLCGLSCRFIAKCVYVNRLVRFINGDRPCSGFIPDIYKLLCKYSLTECLFLYIQSGTFPAKRQWTRTLKSNVLNPERQRLLDSIVFAGDGWTQYNLLSVIVSRLWNVASNTPICNLQASNELGFTVCLCTVQTKLQQMSDRDRESNGTFILLLLSKRHKLWVEVIDHAGYDWYIRFIHYPPSEQCRLILGLAVTNDDRVLLHFDIIKCLLNMLYC